LALEEGRMLGAILQKAPGEQGSAIDDLSEAQNISGFTQDEEYNIISPVAWMDILATSPAEDRLRRISDSVLLSPDTAEFPRSFEGLCPHEDPHSALSSFSQSPEYRRMSNDPAIFTDTFELGIAGACNATPILPISATAICQPAPPSRPRRYFPSFNLLTISESAEILSLWRGIINTEGEE
jgi:hypothetical protein